MPNQRKDSNEVIKFMTLFARLKEYSDDDPTGLDEFAGRDQSVKDLCVELSFAAEDLKMKERRARTLFAAPADPAFIACWRDYEERYASVVLGIQLSALFPEISAVGSSPAPEPSGASAKDKQWKNADYDAEEQARGIKDAIEFAQFNAGQDGRWEEDQQEFVEHIVDGVAAWERLKQDTGFDLKGVFRRRALIPFILVPLHVSAKYGTGGSLSMLRNLQDAHDAFVFGAISGAIALMRSILEAVLRDHYKADGQTLSERINNARPRLPSRANKDALHRLREWANAILHLDSSIEEPNLRSNEMQLEMEVVQHLLVLRALIEGVK